eukprot:PhF_6_TR30187/c0_g1_i1/m.44339
MLTANIFAAQLFGSTQPQDIRDHKLVQDACEIKYGQTPKLLKDIQVAYCLRRSCVDTNRSVQALLQAVIDVDRTREALLACGGVHILVGLLLSNDEWFRNGMTSEMGTGKSLSLKVWTMCLRIITELTVQEGNMPHYLHTTYPTLLHRVLSLLQFQPTFENAVIFCEHMLSAVGPMIVTDDAMWALTSVIEKLNERNLALLCRPLAMVLNFSPVLHTPGVDEVFTAKFVDRAMSVHKLLDRNERRLLEAFRTNGTMVRLVKLLHHELPSTAVSTQYGRSFALAMPMPTPNFGAAGNAVNNLPAIQSFLSMALQHDVTLEDLAESLAELGAMGPGGLGGLGGGGAAGNFGFGLGGNIVLGNANVGATAGGGAGGVGGVEGADAAEPQEEEQDNFTVSWFCCPGPCLALEVEQEKSYPTFISTRTERNEIITPNTAPPLSGLYMEQATVLSIVSCQSEVLYVLSTMLSSRYYSDVWHMLQSADALSVLARLLPNVFPAQAPQHQGTTPTPPDPDSDFHSHLPETQRKIEYVRLVHEMWDARGITDAYRQKIAPQWSAVKRQIVMVFVNRIAEHEEDPCVRNLLCYAVESYLRGVLLSERLEEQARIAPLLIPHIVTHVCTAAKLHKPESLFSLLGEVVRFSKFGIRVLEQALQQSPTTLSTFRSVLLDHPYDCNLFLRSVVLTLHDTTIWKLYDPKFALGGRCVQDTFADFIRTVLCVRTILRDTPIGKISPADLVDLIRVSVPKVGHDVGFTEDVEDALRRSHRECEDVQEYVNEYPLVSSLVLRQGCSDLAKILRNMIVEVELTSADSPDCICVITTTLLFFVLHEEHMEELLDAIRMEPPHANPSPQKKRKAFEPSGADSSDDEHHAEDEPKEPVDPFRNLFEVLCLWVARYSARSHDTLIYCTHIPMEHWQRVLLKLMTILPQYFK